MEVVFATDRAARKEADTGPAYTYRRAKRLAFGTATVSLDPNPSWDELIAESASLQRRRDYILKVENVEEAGAFDLQWDKIRVGEAGLHWSRESLAELPKAQQALHELVRRRLAGSAHKDVFVFVHGFNNTFDDAIYRAAEVWHFMGRVGVPVAYTWPAGYGGVRGYAYDRESGEFTVYHLKQFLKSLAACPEVERVHLIAHSRGADITITALRELHIAYQTRGQATREELKLENLVLAAPDLDEEVFLQRFVAENMLQSARRTTIYASPHDKAMELADLVFGGRRRLGALGPRDFSPRVRRALARLPHVQFIECKVTRFSTSHDYVFAHPAALSDLILVLRDRRDPGRASGRPLQQVEGVWELTNDYLLDTSEDRTGEF